MKMTIDNLRRIVMALTDISDVEYIHEPILHSGVDAIVHSLMDLEELKKNPLYPSTSFRDFTMGR